MIEQRAAYLQQRLVGPGLHVEELASGIQASARLSGAQIRCCQMHDGSGRAKPQPHGFGKVLRCAPLIGQGAACEPGLKAQYALPGSSGKGLLESPQRVPGTPLLEADLAYAAVHFRGDSAVRAGVSVGRLYQDAGSSVEFPAAAQITGLSKQAFGADLGRQGGNGRRKQYRRDLHADCRVPHCASIIDGARSVATLDKLGAAKPTCSTGMVAAVPGNPGALRERSMTRRARVGQVANPPVPLRGLHGAHSPRARQNPSNCAPGRPLLPLALLAAAAALLCPPMARGQFEDVSSTSGLVAPLISGSPGKPYILESMGGGVGFLDYDADGWIDIYLVNGGTLESLAGLEEPPSNRLYRNNRDGTFTDVTDKCGVGDRSWGMGVAVADVDNNGFEDIFVTNYGPNRLYLNHGSCRFEERALSTGLAGSEWSSSAAFTDYDSDGDVDLYVTNYLEFDPADLPEDSLLCRYRGIRVQCGPRGMIPTPDRLFENLGDGRFKDVTEASGIGSAPESYGLGVTWADFDGDGDPDAYVANDSTANFLFENNGDGTFWETALLAGVALSADGKEQAGMGVDFGDYDNDGRPDLAVTNFSEDYNALYRNQGGGLFRDVSHSSGLAEPTWLKLSWGLRFADFDRDGYLDLLIADGHVYPEVDRQDFGMGYRQPNSAFRNLGDGRFVAVRLPTADGAAHSSRGLATGDVHNDGAIDLLIANLDAPPTLLKGSAEGGHWLLVHLGGTVSNRSAIGAKVTLRAGNLTLSREVRGDGSYQSHSDLRLHFGLGGNERFDSLEIDWPGGSRQVLEGGHADRIIAIEESLP